MSGLDPSQLLAQAIRPALATMGERFAGPAAEQLVLGTAAVESNLVWLMQHGAGPALGLWQMEPFTFRDLIARMRPPVSDAVLSLATSADPLPSEVAWNLRFGAAMCRLKYRDDPHPLPRAGDIQGMAVTWKRCYNSRLGAGQPEDFERAWGNLIAGQAERMWP